MWHASVSLLDDGIPVPISMASRKQRRIAGALAMRLIEGVGAGRTLEQTKTVACHARRALSESEIARIDQEWLAIPAVDSGDGPGV